MLGGNAMGTAYSLTKDQIDALINFDAAMAVGEVFDPLLVAAAKGFLSLSLRENSSDRELMNGLPSAQDDPRLFANLLIKSSKIVLLAEPPGGDIELINFAANALSNEIIEREHSVSSPSYRDFIDGLTHRYGPLVTQNVFSEASRNYPSIKLALGDYDAEAINVLVQHDLAIAVVDGSSVLDQRLINAAAHVICRKDACDLIFEAQGLNNYKNVAYGKAVTIILESAGIHQERSLVIGAAVLQVNLLKEGGYKNIDSDFDWLALNLGDLSTEELSAHYRAALGSSLEAIIMQKFWGVSL